MAFLSRHRIWGWGLIGAALALSAIAGGARSQSGLEIAVRATYLYKFAPFVDWPATADPHPGPFSICVVGTDPFGTVLDRAVAGQHVGARPIVIHRMAKADRGASCQVMYVNGAAALVKEALQTVDGTPVLTVTDGPATPGIVDFVTDNGRVRFRVDDQAAAQNGLTISSKLLSLAVSVKPRKGPGANP